MATSTVTTNIQPAQDATNPFGDAAGNPLDYGSLKDKAHTAWQNTLAIQASKNQSIWNQYGVAPTGNTTLEQVGNLMTDPNTTPQALAAAEGNYEQFGRDVGNPYGLIEMQLAQQGQQDQNIEHNAHQRGLGQYGVGHQALSAARNVQNAQRLKTGQDLFNAIQDNVGELGTASGNLLDQLQAIDKAKSDYQGYAGSHYISDGGTVKDYVPPTPAAPGSPHTSDAAGGSRADIAKGIMNQLGTVTYHDRQRAGSQLGRIRDAIRQMPRGATRKGLINQYINALHQAGFHFQHSTWNIH